MKTSNICLCLLAAMVCSLSISAPASYAQGSRTRGAADTVTTPSGLKYVITRKGKGKKPKKNDLVIVHYTGTLLDGSIFDSSRDREPFAFRLGQDRVIKGWEEGIARLKVGDRATFVIPADLAYSDRSVGSIPPNSTLVFDVELLDIKKKSVGDELSKVMEGKGVPQAAGMRYNQLKKSNFKGYHLSEGELNTLGYDYLQKDEIEEAVEIFKINVDAFPQSSNVYDSLGEAYMKQGNRLLAIENYNRSLALDPDNKNALEMLKKLNENN